MKKHTVGVIGLGNMGGNHLRVLERLEHVQAILAFDLAPGWESKLKSALKASAARSVDELLDRCESVVIASSTPTHFDLASQALRRGKHVLIEKPITRSPEEATRLVAAYDDARKSRPSLVCGVGHVERFNPAVQCAHRSLSSGIIGEPISASFRRIGGYPNWDVKGNNVVIDLAVHDVDLARLFVFEGERPWVIGSGAKQVQRPGVVDAADILLGSKKGRTAMVHVNWLTPFRSRMFWVVGSKGFIEVDLIEQTVIVRKSDLIYDFSRSGAVSSFENLTALARTCDVITLGVPRREPLEVELRAFLSATEGGDPFPIAPADGALALELATGALS